MSTTTKVKQPGTLRRLTKHSEFTIGLVVIVLFLVAAFGTSNFLTKYNLMNLTEAGRHHRCSGCCPDVYHHHLRH